VKKIPTMFARDWDGDRWWARREVKAGKAAPASFVAVGHDDETGNTVGWEPGCTPVRTRGSSGTPGRTADGESQEEGL
jgi:hypothetical protein